MTTRDQGTQTTVDISQHRYQDEGVHVMIETDESVTVSVTVERIGGVESKRKRLSVRLEVEEGHAAKKKRKDN